MSVFMQPIATQVIGSGGAPSITFTNIPQGFTDLVIKVSARTTAAQTSNALFITFNGSTSGYSHTYFINTGTSTLTGSNGYGVGTSSIFAGYAPGATSAANVFSNYEVTIPSYSSGNYKSVDMTGIYENTTTAILNWIHAGTWANNSPITSITITPEVTFAQYSSFTLYGVAEQFAGGTPVAPTIGTVTDQAGFVSVAFTPTTNDQASSYSVTSTPSNVTVYGAVSPIVTPAALGVAATYQVFAVNDRGSSASTSSSPITTSNNFVSIATQVVGAGGQSTITFTNIPQNYTHLQLRTLLRNTLTGATEAYSAMIFNGDTGNNYGYNQIWVNGTAVTFNFYSTGVGNLPGPEATNDGRTTGTYAAGIMDILDYSSTVKNKSYRALTGFDDNGFGFIFHMAGTWNSLSPIYGIQISSGATSFKAGSQIALYGIA